MKRLKPATFAKNCLYMIKTIEKLETTVVILVNIEQLNIAYVI